MPFQFSHAEICPSCPHGSCIEDLRAAPIKNRKTKFRFTQEAAMNCTFDSFMPGCDNDPEPDRSFSEYLAQFQSNALNAGEALFPGDLDISRPAIAKVEGDVFELLEAGAFWNAAVAWNNFMDSGQWNSKVFSCPVNAVPTPARKVGIVKLPRGYDATLLFKEDVRKHIKFHEVALARNETKLGLSSPDIVGVRLPHPLPFSMQEFLNPVDDLGKENLALLQGAHTMLEGRIDSSGFLFAVAVKRTTRSDRMYQPLFEANVLKYLIGEVLRGPAFRFYAHLNSFDGADVRETYKAASLLSLIKGGAGGARAIDALYLAQKPRDSAQSILNDLTLFHI
ncbi:Cfr10I/Bse634I restriction endonuclease [Andreprevotia lacus DSM 23236]|jgi:hypothetical protein|uniref:Cfr10I/Bse634I restriction endonuclease n=1 Tax=Andreprevotia lacus DSM 23236 TaxID=1121001 RepID=A0A1W1Y134_9NEIS|nr:Cfr10I/Bse634I family restriction endonuclease [Andreprevotia lacus]SMC29847.1 Cfr10I/Bse634I restriction endonuclease [Andreprevotia lacus DSM 23236]